MAGKNYIVTAADTSPARLAALAQRLRDAGFVVTGLLEAAGVILGHADERRVAGLLALPGVAAIEEERTITIPPPGSDVA
jgi:hypothetical protein